MTEQKQQSSGSEGEVIHVPRDPRDSDFEAAIKFQWDDITQPADLPRLWRHRALAQAMMDECARLKEDPTFDPDALLRELDNALEEADRNEQKAEEQGFPFGGGGGVMAAGAFRDSDRWELVVHFAEKEGQLIQTLLFSIFSWEIFPPLVFSLHTKTTLQGTTPYMELEADVESIPLCLWEGREGLGRLLAAAIAWADRELERQAKQRGEG